MHILDLTAHLPANLEIIFYPSGGDVIITVNRGGRCILRTRIALTSDRAPIVVDIARPSATEETAS